MTATPFLFLILPSLLLLQMNANDGRGMRKEKDKGRMVSEGSERQGRSERTERWIMVEE